MLEFLRKFEVFVIWDKFDQIKIRMIIIDKTYLKFNLDMGELVVLSNQNHRINILFNIIQIEASSIDQIKMTENWLEYDQTLFLELDQNSRHRLTLTLSQKNMLV